MDVHGPTCARLLEVALGGSAPERGRFCRYALVAHPCTIGKEPGAVTLSTERSRALAVKTAILRRRIRFAFAVDTRGYLRSMRVSDTQVEDEVEGWLQSKGSLIELAGVRQIEERTDYMPCDATLPLLTGSWRGEAAFFLTNLVLCTVRKYVAVRPPEQSRSVAVENIYDYGQGVYPLQRRSRAAA